MTFVDALEVPGRKTGQIKLHGPAAFEAIDQIARDPLSDVNLRAAVRAFGAEMLYRVDRREPL